MKVLKKEFFFKFFPKFYSSTIVSSKLSIVNPSIGIPKASSSASITLIAFLVTNEYISHFKLRYTKLRNWMKVITLIYEKSMIQSMVDEKNDH